jgi:long-chain fatty acid transport protein
MNRSMCKATVLADILASTAALPGIVLRSAAGGNEHHVGTSAATRANVTEISGLKETREVTRFRPGPLLLAIVLALAARGSAASGFFIFEQGTKPMGMASAFAAQSNDPTTLFFNPGGLAFFSDDEYLVGLTMISGVGRFQASQPNPGEARTSERAPLRAFPPHIFYVKPISDRWKLGLAEYTPFGLVSEWNNKHTFPGRFVSMETLVTTVDLSANVGYKVSPRIGVSLGLMARVSDIEHHRLLARDGANGLEEIGSLVAKTDREVGAGWNAGVLIHPRRRVHVGLSYRSRVKTDYDGEISTSATVGVVAPAALLDRRFHLRSRITYPDLAIAGLAVDIFPRLTAEIDLDWTGWSSFDGMQLEAPQAPELNQELLGRFSDSLSWRVGIQYTSVRGRQYRAGFAFDQAAQPGGQVGPVLADGDRIGLTLGFGFRLMDLSLMYLKFDESRVGPDGVGPEGKYATHAWLAGITIGYSSLLRR